ncbi:MAG: alpha/beta hydrolase [Herminiimonas sp.]|nr:alpha/beta hydrolase [Herminiimonas sp.]
MFSVDPEIAALIAAGRAAGSLPFEAMTLSAARLAHAARRETHQLAADAVSVRRDFTVAGPAGPIRLRLYRPAATSAEAVLPCLVFMHGGGWMLGSLDSHDALCCHLAKQAHCCVIAIDYRLAPESPFPAGLDDCVAGYRTIVGAAAALKIDPGRIAVGGDSAGGNFAAVLALMGRAGTVPPPIQQTLIYPVVDLDQNLVGYGPDSPGMLITGATMLYFRDHYTPTASDRIDWRASPLKANSLADLPPALVVVCGHDPLRAEGLAYADRLERQGGKVTLLYRSDLPHGVITMTRITHAATEIQDIVALSLRTAFRLLGRDNETTEGSGKMTMTIV